MPSAHFDLATYPVKDTIKLLTALLEKIIRTNDRLHLESGNQNSNYTCFHARSIPSISIHAYFTRILKYCPCANECLIAILVYFDQMTEAAKNQNTQSFQMDSYNVHRLIITGLMISSKLYSDVFFTNTRYAKVGGLPVSELNTLEIEFLRLNNYNLFVDIDKLQVYGDNVLEHWNQIQASNKHYEDIIKPLNNLTINNNNLDTTSILKSPTESLDIHWNNNKQNLFSKHIGNEISENT